MIKINTPKIERTSKQLTIFSDIQINDSTTKLWFSLESKYENFITENLSSAFLIALIPYAMVNKHDITLSESLSETLHHNFNQIVSLNQTIFKTNSYPQLHADFYQENDTPLSKGVITGFSSGIDSFCTLHDYHYENRYPHYKISHLFFNNVGSHGLDIKVSQTLFEERYAHQKIQADKIGLELIKVDSNAHTFCPFEFINFHEHGNVAIAYLLSNKIGTYLYSSAYEYNECIFGNLNDKDIAHTDPSLLPLLSNNELRIIPVGQQYTRFEKTNRVTQAPDSYNMLNVCISEDTNCSKCPKCIRTIMTLDILGKLDHYKNVFDASYYKANREFYLKEVYKKPNSVFNRDIITNIQERDFPIPSLVLMKARLAKLIGS